MILEKKRNDNIQMERGIKIINNYFNTEIRIRNRKRSIVEPRQIYFYLMRKNSQYNLATISNYLGFDHTTAIHSCERSKVLIDVDDQFKNHVDKLDVHFKKLFGIKTPTLKEILLDYAKYTDAITQETETIIDDFMEIKKLKL